MISCVFNGRLGNNLFQLANVISMAKRLDTDFIVPENTHGGYDHTKFLHLWREGSNLISSIPGYSNHCDLKEF